MVAQFLGFSDYGDESKVMGLSTFGYREYTDRLRTIISREKGQLRLNLKYFAEEAGVGTSWSEATPDITQLYNENLEHLLGSRRDSQEEITTQHQNIASSMQQLTEEIICSIIDELHTEYFIPNVVFTGGLAYNSLLNGRISAETAIEGERRVVGVSLCGAGGLKKSSQKWVQSTEAALGVKNLLGRGRTPLRADDRVERPWQFKRDQFPTAKVSCRRLWPYGWWPTPSLCWSFFKTPRN